MFSPFNPEPNDKNFRLIQIEQIVDDILKCIQNEKKVACRVENIARKGEIACYKQFLLFSQFFHSYISLVRRNAALCGNGLRHKFQLSSTNAQLFPYYCRHKKLLRTV